MIKKQISFINHNQELVEKDIYFKYTLKGIRNFERITGQNFFEVFSFITNEYFKKLADVGLSKDGQVTNETIIKLLPVLNDVNLLNFVLDWTCAFYCVIDGSRTIQNELTTEEIMESDWIMEIANPLFFIEIYNECNANTSQFPKKTVNQTQKLHQI